MKKVFLKILCFILILKLASCKPVVVGSATMTYEDEEFSGNSLNSDDEDQSGDFSVYDVTDNKKELSDQKSKDDKKVEEFWARHPVDMHDEKFVATDYFKQDYKNTFGYEFNGFAEMSYEELKMLPDDKYFSRQEFKEYTKEELATIRYEEESFEEMDWFEERGYFDEDYDPEDFEGEELTYHGKKMFTEEELKKIRSGEDFDDDGSSEDYDVDDESSKDYDVDDESSEDYDVDDESSEDYDVDDESSEDYDVDDESSEDYDVDDESSEDFDVDGSSEDYVHEEFTGENYFDKEYPSEDEMNAQYLTGDGSYDGGNYY